MTKRKAPLKLPVEMAEKPKKPRKPRVKKTPLHDPFTYLNTATFTGKGYFPTDMLRYDCCWPATTEDAVAMTRSPDNFDMDEEYSVTVKTRLPGFTTARWASFGWRVKQD